MDNYFAQFHKDISPEREQEIYDTIENLLDMTYEEYKASWGIGGLGLPGMFYDFGFLIRSKRGKSLLLEEKLNETHRKQDKDIAISQKEKDKIAEVNINKQDYCGRARIDPKSERLVKIREFSIMDDDFFVIGITLMGEGGKMMCGGTTIISKSETPNLYADVYQKYKWHYE